MRTLVTLATGSILMVMLASTPSQAGSSGCHSCTPSIVWKIAISGTHGVPGPSRNGRFVGHFDANCVPQSIITLSTSGAYSEVVPCPPNGYKYKKNPV